ncbi:hypothetical protein ES705_48726 [subsurface metagenome]
MKLQINKTTTPIVSPAVIVSVGDWDESNLITLAWVARVVSEPPVMSISILGKWISVGREPERK